jgi:hypothetical protein
LLSREREKKDKVGPVILYGGKMNTNAKLLLEGVVGHQRRVLATL